MTLSQWFAQCPLPKNEARLLLQHITGFTHAQTVTRSDFRLPEDLKRKYSFGNWIRFALDIPPYQAITLPKLPPKPQTEVQ